MLTTMRLSSRIGVKRQPFGLYPTTSPRLFVPHPDMWLVHEASTPQAVAARAGLSRRIFEVWSREYRSRAPWLPTWLYGGARPAESEDVITPHMLAFRAQAQLKAISEATRGKRLVQDAWVGSQPRRLPYVDTGIIHHWRAGFRTKYPTQQWLDSWLRRGDDPPAGIIVVTPDQVRRCARAWDYINLANDAGIKWPETTYQLWFCGTPPDIPAGPDRVTWLKWLYSSPGYRQAPAFVIGLKLQAYRRQGSVKALRKTAKVGERQYQRWHKSLLDEAIQAAQTGNATPDSEGFQSQPPATKDGMMSYARASTRAARCGHANVRLLTAEFDRLRREAATRGVERDVDGYLNYKGVYGKVRFRRQRGLLRDAVVAEQRGTQHVAAFDGNLFVPSPAFCLFHERATGEWVAQRIGELESLPGFEEWFVDWVSPRPRLSRRGMRSHDPEVGGGLPRLSLVVGGRPNHPSDNGLRLVEQPVERMDELIDHVAETSRHVQRIANHVVRDDPPAMPSGRKADFLCALYDMRAFGEAIAQSAEAIAAKRGEGEPSSYHRVASWLKGQGLIASKEGAGGGYYLTELGRKCVELDRKRQHSQGKKPRT